jgi:hypothetical protein
VRPVSVVVIDVVAGDKPQVPLAGDQHPVQALAAGTADPTFCDRVRTRRPDRSLDDPAANRGELGVPIPDQGSPVHRWDGGDPGQVHASFRICHTVDGATL